MPPSRQHCALDDLFIPFVCMAEVPPTTPSTLGSRLSLRKLHVMSRMVWLESVAAVTAWHGLPGAERVCDDRCRSGRSGWTWMCRHSAWRGSSRHMVRPCTWSPCWPRYVAQVALRIGISKLRTPTEKGVQTLNLWCWVWVVFCHDIIQGGTSSMHHSRIGRRCDWCMLCGSVLQTWQIPCWSPSSVRLGLTLWTNPSAWDFVIAHASCEDRTLVPVREI